MKQKKPDNRVLLMAVAFNMDTNMYTVDLGKGSNVPETAFAMSVVIKCLLRDKLIKSATEVTDLIQKYLDDPQYEELKK